MRRTSRAWAIAGLGGAVTGAILFARRVNRWGATAEELSRPLPGDDQVPDPLAASTRAVSVRAPASAVWPWLVQMGWRRAGWYSYDRIDNDRIPALIASCRSCRSCGRETSCQKDPELAGPSPRSNPAACC